MSYQLLATLSPPEWLHSKAGSCVRHFNVSLIVWTKSQDSVYKPPILKRKESWSGSNRGPFAYQLSALPLGHTGSHSPNDMFITVINWAKWRSVPGLTWLWPSAPLATFTTLSCYQSCPCSWKLRTQKLKTHLVRTRSLNVLPFKPGVGQYIAIHATLTAREELFLAYFYPSSPFTCIFSKTSPNFFLCWPAE